MDKRLRHLRIGFSLGFLLCGVACVSAGDAAPAAVEERQAHSAAPEPAEAPRLFEVKAGFDGRPFSYRMALASRKDGYSVYRLTYPSPVTTEIIANNTIHGEYYLPDGIEPDSPPRPAVICLHILNGNFELVRLLCSVLSSRGIPAVMFKLPFYGERSPPGGRAVLMKDTKVFVSMLPQAIQDIRRTVDFLCARPEVDPEKTGIAGISMGAFLAATATHSESRLARSSLILGGGDLLGILRRARETAQLDSFMERLPADERQALEDAITRIDPLQNTGRLRELAGRGRVLMINAGADEVVPRACTQRLADAIGLGDKVVWLEGLGHYTAMAALPEVIDRTARFFARDLPPGVAPERVPDSETETPLQTLALLLRDVCAFFGPGAADGHCHFADLAVSATERGGKSHNGELRIVRGSAGRFSLQCSVPRIGAAALGQGEYPWMAAPGNAVFRGVLNPLETRDPLVFFDPAELVKVRVVAGLLAMVSVAPQAFEQWLAVTEEQVAGGGRSLHIKVNDKPDSSLSLRMKPDGRTPEQLDFSIDGTRGTVTFRQWQTGTLGHDALFEAPRDGAQKDVEQADVYRIFAALFGFAMEKLE